MAGEANLQVLHWMFVGSTLISSGVHNLSGSALCSYIEKTDSCQSDGFLDYVDLVYCQFASYSGSLILFFLWMLFLFLAMSATAEIFLCPSLAAISKQLKLSQNIAGVTFLAFGNGSPDVFSSIAAVTSGAEGDPALSFGALLGAGIFLTTVIVGIVGLIKPFTLMQRPLLRDLIFFIFTIFLVFCMLRSGRATRWGSLGFIALYFVYVLVVVGGRIIRLKYRSFRKSRKSLIRPDETSPILTNDEDDNDDHEPDHFTDIQNNNNKHHKDESRPGHVAASADYIDRKREILYPAETRVRTISGGSLRDLTDASDGGTETFLPWYQDVYEQLKPCSKDAFLEMKHHEKLFLLARAPIVFVLKLTIPLLDEEKQDSNWCKPLLILHCFLSPQLAVFITKNQSSMIANVLPIWALGGVLGLILALIVHLTSIPTKPPVYHKVVAYIGFLISVIWIYCLAKEIVNIVQTFGIVFQVTTDILGLTVLAWSNSLGDLVADISVARDGYPRMAVSACFGGPLFNMLLGIGIPFTYKTWSEDIELTFNPVLQILCLFLLISLCFSLLVLVFSNFNVTRPYAILLLFLYVTFLVIALLTEIGQLGALM